MGSSILRGIAHASCIIVLVGEMAELVYGARLERVLGRKALAGSNPVLSAKNTVSQPLWLAVCLIRDGLTIISTQIKTLDDKFFISKWPQSLSCGHFHNGAYELIH